MKGWRLSPPSFSCYLNYAVEYHTWSITVYIAVFNHFPLSSRRCCDVESTSMTLIQRRNNVVSSVGFAFQTRQIEH